MTAMAPIASLLAIELDTTRVAAMTDFYASASGLTPLEITGEGAALRGDAGGDYFVPDSRRAAMPERVAAGAA